LIGDRNGVSGKMLDAICAHAPPSEGSKYGAPELIDKAEALKKFPRYDIT
jgi:hypothetical protein